ncbi:MAG: alpha/beta hydrolase family protein [Planctomycetota bacterium]|jgi:pimeloyl-ACP methyl ester carboxylesterase
MPQGDRFEIPSGQIPEEVKKVRYLSSADNLKAPTLFYAPKTGKPVPLLVALHTWGGDYLQIISLDYANWCIENNWAFVHPNFRGPNRNPYATGSELVVKDILSVVDYAKANVNIDPNRIYLLGVSGGGHAALLMAGRAPEIWAGVSVWVPILDLKDWYFECKKSNLHYTDEIVKSCGGVPGQSPEVDLEYKKRSPVTYLKNAKGVKIDINAGIYDGHTGSIPISHTLEAFNILSGESDRISNEDVEYFVKKAKIPPHLKQDIHDPDYGNKQPLFRKMSGNTRITIFNGTHEIIYEAGLKWLGEQRKH